MPTIRLAGVPVHAVTTAECVDLILAALDARRGGWVLTLNVDHLRACARDPIYAELCRQATITVADGMPLVWASRLQGAPLPERVAGASLLLALTAAAAERGRSVFFLGGAPGTALAAAAALQQRHATLRVAGTLCPPIGFEQQPEVVSALQDTVCASAPDIVYVALGMRKQDVLIERLRPALPQAWFLGVGISFSFLSGAVRRAPLWMQRAGLEWLHRLAQEPRRLGKRYLIQDLPFGVGLLGRSLLSRIGGRPAAREPDPEQGN